MFSLQNEALFSQFFAAGILLSLIAFASTITSSAPLAAPVWLSMLFVGREIAFSAAWPRAFCIASASAWSSAGIAVPAGIIRSIWSGVILA